MEDNSSDNWRSIQRKTFTKWVNNKLVRAEYPQIKDLFTDLSSGVALVNLLHALGKSIPYYNKDPISRIHKMENLTIILEFIKNQKISLVNIGAEDIVDGNQKLILGLIWTLISRLSMTEMLSNEFLSLRDEILAWAKRVTAGYENVHIENMTTSWQDGIAFNAIIHKFRPSLATDFFNLDPSNKYENCEKAFEIAEKHLDIPKLFDPEDIIDAIKPDEKVILTYLSQFYQKFLHEEAVSLSKSQILSVLNGLDFTVEAIHAYESRAREFLKKKETLAGSESLIKSLMKTLAEELRRFEKANLDLCTESTSLANLLNNINDICFTYRLKPYITPEEISLEKIQHSTINYDFSPDSQNVFNSLKQINNEEAKEAEKCFKIAQNILSDFDESNQVALINETQDHIKSFTFTTQSKQKLVDFINDLIESRKMKLALRSEYRTEALAFIEEVKEMFAQKDTKKTGYVDKSELLKILKQMHFESVALVKNSLDSIDQVSLDQIVELLTKIKLSQFSKDQVKTSFSLICDSNDLRVKLSNICEDSCLKGLKKITKDEGYITFEEIESYLEE